MGGSLDRIERQLGVSLAAWGAGSVVLGVVLRTRAGGERRRAFGSQTAGWGAIDLAIAAAAHLRAARRDRPMGDGDRRRLHKILVANTVLDAGYIAAGAVAAARADRVAESWPGSRSPSAEQLRGGGAAVVVQGAFLLVLDSTFAARTRG